MEVLSTRLSTFSHSRIKKHNIPAHAAWPLSSSQYPRLLPELLAEAGWFYTPSKEDPDLVTCFLCGKQVGGWGEEDDPFEEHVGHQEGKCGWARTKCLVESQKRKGGQRSGEVWKARFTDASELPQSKALESARLSTFAKWWPHDKKKAWLPTSKNLAKAGFIFSPNGKGSDMASCLYCELGLDGWSPTDDPFHEHQIRTPKCPFFIATLYVPPKAGTSASAAAAAVQEEDEEEGDEDEFEMIDAPVMKTPATSGKGKKAAEKAPSTVATTKSVASTKSRSTRTTKDPEPTPSISTAPTSRHTRNGSTTSQPAAQPSQLGRSTRAQPQPSENGDVEDSTPALGRSTRGKAAAPVAVAALAPKRGGGRGKKAVLEEEATPAPEAEVEEELDLVAEEEVEVEEEKAVAKGKGKGKAAAGVVKKATAAKSGKGKKAALAVEEEEEEEGQEVDDGEMVEESAAEEVGNEEEEDKVMSDPPAPPPPSKLPSSASRTHSRNPSASSTTSKSKTKPLPDLPPSSAKPKPHPPSSSTLTTAPSSSSTAKSKPKPNSSKPPSTTSSSVPTKPLNGLNKTTSASSSASRIPTPVKSPLAQRLAPAPGSALRGSPFNTKEFELAKAQAVAEGARSAEKVVQTWAKMFSPAPAASSSLSRKVAIVANNGTPLAGRGVVAAAAEEDEEDEEEEEALVMEQEAVEATGVGGEGGKEGEVSLTEEQGQILVEEWVRMEYQLRHDELKRFGEEEKIGAFVKAAAEARRRLVEDIEVEEEEE